MWNLKRMIHTWDPTEGNSHELTPGHYQESRWGNQVFLTPFFFSGLRRVSPGQEVRSISIVIGGKVAALQAWIPKDFSSHTWASRAGCSPSTIYHQGGWKSFTFTVIKGLKVPVTAPLSTNTFGSLAWKINLFTGPIVPNLLSRVQLSPAAHWARLPWEARLRCRPSRVPAGPHWKSRRWNETKWFVKI